jgi:hypothetical protein
MHFADWACSNSSSTIWDRVLCVLRPCFGAHFALSGLCLQPCAKSMHVLRSALPIMHGSLLLLLPFFR